MAKLHKKSAIAIMQEATQGTARASAASDFIYVEGLTLDNGLETIKRDFSRPYLDSIPMMVGQRMSTVKFKCELKGGNLGSGSGNLAANGALSSALEACGLTGNALASAAGTVTFYPTSSAASSNYYGPGKSASIEVYLDGIKQVIPGSLGSFKLSGERAKQVFAEFEFKGIYQEPTDAAFPATTPNAAIPPILQSASLNLLGYSPIASKFEFDLGASVQPRDDVSSSGGLLGFQITDYDMKGSLDPEVSILSVHNAFNKFVNAATGSLSAVIGNVAGNIIEFKAPMVQYADVNYGDRKDFLIYNTPLQFNGVTGNDSFSIAFK